MMYTTEVIQRKLTAFSTRTWYQKYHMIKMADFTTITKIFAQKSNQVKVHHFTVSEFFYTLEYLLFQKL